MPIFEYVCDDCKESFEKLVNRDDEVSCPKCQGPHLSKQYSRFGMGKGEGASKYESLPVYNSGGGCGCTPSTCGCKN